MKLEVTSDNKYLKIIEADELELKQIEITFTKTVRNYWILLKNNPNLKRWGWTGKVSFIKNGRIPLGLWHELLKMCDKYDYECDIYGLDSVIDYNFDENAFIKWQEEFFKDSSKKPYDYQVNTAINILKYGWSSNELATSAGKTLIVFMVFAYLKKHNILKRMLIVVPNNSLVIQGISDFDEYSDYKRLLNYKIQPIGDGASKDKKEVDIVIGTFQTLRELPIEFFEDFNVICIDEAHSAKNKSVKTVISKCKNSEIRFGLSGTLGIHKDDADSFTILSLIGPCVNKVSANYLFGNNEEGKKYATPVYIRQIIMDYLPYEKRNDLLRLKAKKVEFDGSTMLAFEKKIIVENKERLDFIVDVISKVKENALVLFHNIQDGYGKQICNALKKVLPNNYDIFYVDGAVSQELRKHYIDQMDQNTKSVKIMVASFGTFSTGISISNLSYVFFTESFKSEKIILQSIGRGMRLFEGKDVVNIIDFVDDFSYKGFNNYSLKHSFDREEMYINQGFTYKKIIKIFGERLN